MRHLESKKSTSYSLHGFSLDQETAFRRQFAAISMANEAAEGDITNVPDLLRWSLVLSTVLLQADFMVFDRLSKQRIFS
jgi:hypothetical protein